MAEIWGSRDAKVWERLLFEIVFTMAGGGVYIETGKRLRQAAEMTEVLLFCSYRCLKGFFSCNAENESVWHRGFLVLSQIVLPSWQ
jgi:hypothetical protein